MLRRSGQCGKRVNVNRERVDHGEMVLVKRLRLIRPQLLRQNGKQRLIIFFHRRNVSDTILLVLPPGISESKNVPIS